jgi:hypothetical protein
VDGTSSGDQATVGSHWTILQTNLDGVVIGPASAIDGHLAVFDGASGKLIKDGGAPAAGTVTAVTASYPLASSGSTTPNITLNPLVAFIVINGSIGTDVGPHLRVRQAGQVIKCKIDTKASDPSIDLTFKIKQNGVDVFSVDPTITHGTASGTLATSTSLTSVPLAVAADDLFTIDITSGSSAWQFTAQLE